VSMFSGKICISKDDVELHQIWEPIQFAICVRSGHYKMLQARETH